jgi:hypothetical protein
LRHRFVEVDAAVGAVVYPVTREKRKAKELPIAQSRRFWHLGHLIMRPAIAPIASNTAPTA